MPVSTMDARRTQGTFQRALDGHQPASRQARHAALRPPGASTLRISNSPAHLLTMACLLGSLPRAGTGDGPSPRASAGMSDPTSALLPGTSAMPPRYTVIASGRAAPTLTTRLSGIANMVAGTCVSHPRACKAALGTGAVLGVGAITATLAHATASRTSADNAPGRLPDAADITPSRLAVAPSTHATSEGPVPTRRITVADVVRDLICDMQLPDPHGGTGQRLEAALVATVVKCAGSNACVRDHFARLLDGLSAPDQQRLEDFVDYRAAQPPTRPPGAPAQPLLPGARDALARLLAKIYSLDKASYLHDVQRIVDATCGIPEIDKAPCQSRHGDNDARLDMIQRLFEEAGHAVQRLPYVLADTIATELDIPAAGHNLLIDIDGPPAAPGQPQRSLMLVAHGDMIGEGSSGAYDNGSGVALLLHLARRITPAMLPAGTRVQLLVTSKEENGLLGATAFVNACLQRHTCPTLALNIDLVGRGGPGYLISTSDTIDRFFFHVDTDEVPAPGVISAEEMAGMQLLQNTFATHGFTRHLMHEAYMLPSDHVAFQRGGVAALGITQIDEDDAHASKAEQDADVQRLTAWRQVNWTALQPLLDSPPRTRTPDEQTRLDTLLHAEEVYDNANKNYLAAVEALPAGAQVRVIHTAHDQMSNLHPADAVAFCNAVQAFVTRWVIATSAS